MSPVNPAASGRLAGKVVVVTGAARGQGAAETEALAAEGAHVIATDVLDFEYAGGDRPGGGVTQLRHDVTDAAGWAELAEFAGERYGRVDALVNNAGVAARERIPHVSAEAWERTFAINVTGPLLGIQALVPLMAPGSSIVNICSVAAVSGHAAAAYTASKWALRGLTRSASLELGERGIRVNAVMPGLIDTPLMASAPPAFQTAAVAEIPLGRVGVPADIAPTIVFLVSDDSAYYNGAELVIDGGMTAHVSHKHIADATRPS
ncbi:SDR family NAD(P)-dependent oxidoreductase [Streptomyces sp. NPDC013157]|uniref:SDR family NAD(P)-dependent oxidoreductase n=1 Tax=unclassified Streptomyces TaxID=2593676 RepID=UPI0036B13C91